MYSLRCLGSYVLRASVIFVETHAGDLSMVARVSPLSSGGSDFSRRERRLRSFWRYQQLSLKMMAASMSHHSWQHRASVGVQTDEAVNEHVTLAAVPYAATTSPISVTEYATLAPVVSYVTPAPVIEHMPAPVIKNIAPPPAVFDPTGLENPQISTSAVKISQVVDPFPLSDDFAAPMYNQVHQGQTVATMRPHVIIQEPPQVPVGEWSQEQFVETIEVLPQERVDQHTAKQIVHVPIHQIQEQSADLVTPQFRITAVEASEVIGSFSLSEEFAAPA